MGVGAVVKLLDGFGIFRAVERVRRSAIGAVKQSFVRLGIGDAVAEGRRRAASRTSRRRTITPAYFGVGYIIGPELGSLNFAGGLLAWGLFVPTARLLPGPVAHRPVPRRQRRQRGRPRGPRMVVDLWKFIVRPIAVGGMLVGASYTLYKMRKNLIGGVKRGIEDVKKSARPRRPPHAAPSRT